MRRLRRYYFNLLNNIILFPFVYSKFVWLHQQILTGFKWFLFMSWKNVLLPLNHMCDTLFQKTVYHTSMRENQKDRITHIENNGKNTHHTSTQHCTHTSMLNPTTFYKRSEKGKVLTQEIKLHLLCERKRILIRIIHWNTGISFWEKICHFECGVCRDLQTFFLDP